MFSPPSCPLGNWLSVDSIMTGGWQVKSLPLAGASASKSDLVEVSFLRTLRWALGGKGIGSESPRGGGGGGVLGLEGGPGRTGGLGGERGGGTLWGSSPDSEPESSSV